MSRFFYLSLTLIVLIAVASAGWLRLGVIAGEEDIVVSTSPSDRVFAESPSKAVSSEIFTTETEEIQEQAAFDEFAEIDPFVANQRVENPFAADPDIAHDEPRLEPFASPQKRRIRHSSSGSPRIQSDAALDLDQPTRNALKEMVIQIEREADELQQLGRLKEAEHRRHVYRRLQALMERRKNRSSQPARPLPVEINLNDSRFDSYDIKWDPSIKIAKEERETQRKIEHLQRAIENLKQAGLEKQAQELEHQIARMKVELRVLRRKREIEKREWLQRHEREPAPRDNVHEALHDLRHEIRNLRNEVREMHELLKQHVKHGGKDEVELTPRNIEIEVEEELRPFDKRDKKKGDHERIEIEEIDIQARDEEEVEEEHEERPLPTPDNELPPINQPEQIEEEAEVLPREENKIEAY